MAANTSDLLPKRPVSGVHELAWGQSVRVRTSHGDAVVHAVEVKHWGARLGRDTYRGYAGWIVEREGRRILIGGDTAETGAFRGHRHLGPFAAAVMPIGAYDPWIANHCTPEQAVRMADAAGARLFVPVHHQSFVLSREPLLEPIQRADEALRHEQGRLALREIGQTVVVPV
jgi:L-ascorbate metabolism protein UlaG (beta-lactamase superfamily)